ncbi:hypothetical protein V7S43_015156 [Phytophthora oleae]|uniref:Expansin-like EG45 domain-containing protein n=1 Tax=Phytophthora oleae TaxID=2107226 RepID=A0ABD3F424_9STRA
MNRFRRVLLAFAISSAGFRSTNAYTGHATTYGLTDPSGGNCNFMKYPQAAVSNFVAINKVQWDSSMSCGRCAQVTCTDSLCSGRSQESEIVYVVDQCPGCNEGDLDLSPSVFKSITGMEPGIVEISWEFVTCPVTGNIEYCLKEGSNSFWAAIQPTHTTVGIESVTIDGKSTSMVASSFYFLLNGDSTEESDLSNLKISMTSVQGETITDVLSFADGKCVEGSSQFTIGESSSVSTSTASITEESTTEPPTTSPPPTTNTPTTEPPSTNTPTSTPTEAPTTAPPTTSTPTIAPTESPTETPSTTSTPTEIPTEALTVALTTSPPTSKVPTIAPTESPTTSRLTSSAPTEAPPTTSAPMEAPTTVPPLASTPTITPTGNPTTAPRTANIPTTAPPTALVEAQPTTPTTTSPITTTPTNSATEVPTDAATTAPPTTNAPTNFPTDTPTTVSPTTSKLSTSAPTRSPTTVTTNAPTEDPTTSSPSIDTPTNAPKNAINTAEATTVLPTSSPSADNTESAGTSVTNRSSDASAGHAIVVSVVAVLGCLFIVVIVVMYIVIKKKKQLNKQLEQEKLPAHTDGSRYSSESDYHTNVAIDEQTFSYTAAITPQPVNSTCL